MAFLRNAVLGTALVAAALFGINRIVSYNAPTQTAQPRYEKVIRISNDPWPIYYSCSQEEGEKMLQQLAGSAEQEDRWIYRVRGGKGEWIDIGIQANTYKKEDGTIRHSIQASRFIEDCVQEGDEITDYHIHPQGNFKLDLGDIKRDYKTFGQEFEADTALLYFDSLARETLLSYQFPSVEDWQAHARLKRMFESRHVKVNPSRVVGKYVTSSQDCDEKKNGEKITTEVASIENACLSGAVADPIDELVRRFGERGYRLDIIHKDVDNFETELRVLKQNFEHELKNDGK